MKITGLSSLSIGDANSKVNLNVCSLVHAASFEVNALVVPKITAPMPRFPINISSFSYLQGLPVADPKFHETSKIDILLGADIVPSILRSGLKNGPKNSPIAINTVLSWVLSGKTPVQSSQEVRVNHLSLDETVLPSEELPTIPRLTEEQQGQQQVPNANCYPPQHSIKMTDSKKIINSIYTELRDEKDIVNLDHVPSIPTLGVQWTPSSDTSTLVINAMTNSNPVTLRTATGETERSITKLGVHIIHIYWGYIHNLCVRFRIQNVQNIIWRVVVFNFILQKTL